MGILTAEDAAAVQTLAAWFSPAYPVGGYSYSHGLEWAVAAGIVTDGPRLEAWVDDLLTHGAGRNDAILLAAAYAAHDIDEVAELALALAPSAERRMETMDLGAAFVRTTAPVWGLALAPMAYPVAVGRAARLLGLPRGLTAALYLQAFAAGVISAGLRLIPLGQTEGQRITRALMPRAAEMAGATAGLDDLGGSTFGADLAAMLHETQDVRLYRS